MRTYALEALFGGAAGGGKSSALLMSALQYVDVPGYSAILFRKTFADLSLPGALMDRANEIRLAIAEMQLELPPNVRVSGAALREWQDEAARIYLECRHAAQEGTPSPYTQGRLRAWERTA